METLLISRSDKIDLKDPSTITEVNTVLDTNAHVSGVQKVFRSLLKQADAQIEHHDHTKYDYLKLFTRYLKSGCNNEIKDEVRGVNWFKDIHVVEERHHLNDRVPLDVNLIDILEWVADCTVAGLQRKGTVRPLTIDSDILQTAVKNTVQMIIDNVEVDGRDEGTEKEQIEQIKSATEDPNDN